MAVRKSEVTPTEVLVKRISASDYDALADSLFSAGLIEKSTQEEIVRIRGSEKAAKVDHSYFDQFIAVLGRAKLKDLQDQLKKIVPETSSEACSMSGQGSLSSKILAKKLGGDEIEKLTSLLKEISISTDIRLISGKSEVLKEEMIDKLRYLKVEGHTIVLYTGSQKKLEHSENTMVGLISPRISNDKEDNTVEWEEVWKKQEIDKTNFNPKVIDEVLIPFDEDLFEMKTIKKKKELWKEFYYVNDLTRKFIRNEMEIEIESKQGDLKKKMMISGHIFIRARIFQRNIDWTLFVRVVTFAEELRRTFRNMGISIKVTTITPNSVSFDHRRSISGARLVNAGQRLITCSRQDILEAVKYVLHDDNEIQHIFLKQNSSAPFRVIAASNDSEEEESNGSEEESEEERENEVRC